MSIRRPAPKPAVAPKTEPRRSAIETSVTSTMSARAAERRVRRQHRDLHEHRHEEEARMPSASRRSPRRPRLLRARGRAPTGARSGSTNGCTWMCLKMSVSLWFTLVTVPIEDVAREERGQLAAARRAGGDDRVAVLDLLVLADAVEDERVGARCRCSSMPTVGTVARVDRAHGAARVADQHHARDVAVDLRHLPDERARASRRRPRRRCPGSSRRRS